MNKLVDAWKQFQPIHPPYLLNGDEVVLDHPEKYCRVEGWNGYVTTADFGAPSRISPLHLDLLPIPFVGNLETATVFLLMLNPGFGPHDYFGEYQVSEYRAALLDNLRQTQGNSFLFLDPKFSWHGGYGYWHSKLGKLIAEFANRTAISYGAARHFMQSKVVVLELAPYHSEFPSSRSPTSFNAVSSAS